MIRFERTRNLAVVRHVLTDAKIWPYIGDDFSADPDLFRPNADPRIWYVLVNDSSVWPEGLFSFIPENPICWAVHVAMVRGNTPRFNREVGQKIVPWIWENTDCRRLIANVPGSNPAAVMFGLKAMGLRQYGLNEASFLKGGKLWDQVLMGISRPEE